MNNKKVIAGGPVIGIIGGRGNMGSYFADYFRRGGYKVLVSDKRTRLTNSELVGKSDVVIVSVPIGKTEEVIAEVAPLIKKEGVIMDLTSLKEFPVRAMLKSKSEVIGLHPLFSHTNPLPGQTVIACPVRGRKWYPWIKEFFESNGANVVELTPKEHDKITAVVQALVHFADIAFGHALKRIKVPVGDYLKYATPSSELKIAFSARLLAQDPALYADIQILNPHAAKVLKEYVKSINELIEIHGRGDVKKFKKYFASAADYLKEYKQKAFDDTNYLIYALLERRRRAQGIKAKKISAGRAVKSSDASHHLLAVLGPRFTFSDLAAREFLGESYDSEQIYFASNIREVFRLVEKGGVDTGLVPVENMINGSVRETFDALFECKVHISEKFSLPVTHALCALQGVSAKDIDTISSHPQALEQCAAHLTKNFPRARLAGASSTIAALEKMRGENDRHTAVILPLKFAESQNMNILAADIGDMAQNSTSFVAIKKGTLSASSRLSLLRKATPDAEKTANPETAIAFYFGKDRPGSLLKIFRDFADEGINMNKIESRPSRKQPGNYIFFLNFEKGIWESEVKRVLKKIRKKTAALKILGSYPAVKPGNQ